MDTITIEGKEVPVSEVAAFYARKDQIEADATRQRQALETANGEIAKSAAAVQAIEQAKNDPAFAKSMVDAISTVHKDSAYFAGTVDPPAPTPPAPTPGTPPVPPTTTLPAPGAPAGDVVNAAGQSEATLALARQVEDLQRQVLAGQSQSLLNAKLAEIKEQFPSLDEQEILKSAVEQKIPLEHLHLVAGDAERSRLAKELEKRNSNSSLLNELMFGRGNDDGDLDQGLKDIGVGLTAAQVDGTADVDYAKLDTGGALALAMAQQDHKQI